MKFFIVLLATAFFAITASAATDSKTQYIQHPDAAKGLSRIEADGTYDYKTEKPKASERSGSFKFAVMTAPEMYNSTIDRSFDDYYGSDPLVGLLGTYSFPLTRGSLGLSIDLESGFSVVQGDGFFNREQSDNSELRSVESYTLFMVPLYVLATAKLQFSDRQWFVPYASGGGVLMGLVELRSDEQGTNLAGTFGAAVGGGVLVSVSRWAPTSAFQLQSEYGINDLWINIEGRAVIGLDEELDISQNLFSLGATFDF